MALNNELKVLLPFAPAGSLAAKDIWNRLKASFNRKDFGVSWDPWTEPGVLIIRSEKAMDRKPIERMISNWAEKWNCVPIRESKGDDGFSD